MLYLLMSFISVMNAEFRGKPLQGRELKFPSNYEGHVATDLKHSLKTQPQFDGQIHDKTLRLTSKFDSFTYWNWDRPPSGMDCPLKLVDWMDIAEIVSFSCIIAVILQLVFLQQWESSESYL